MIKILLKILEIWFFRRQIQKHQDVQIIWQISTASFLLPVGKYSYDMGEGGNISYNSEVSEAIIVCPLFTENVFF